jgi:hypothetical protein
VLAIVSPASADDRFVQQGPPLLPGDSGNGMSQHFGTSLALSGDGNLAVVGEPWYTTYPPGQCCSGAAWVFARTGSSWAPEAKLVESSADSLSRSVALSGDGSTALLGGFHPGSAAAAAGSAWAFSRSGATWTKTAELVPPGWPPQYFSGDYAALSGDGNTAFVWPGSGGTFSFARAGDAWTQQGQPLPVGGGLLGMLALSADGNTALLGGDGSGGARVFSRVGGSWIQGPQLTDPSLAADPRYGFLVALSADGNTAMIGPTNGGVRVASVFTRSGDAWASDGPPLTTTDEIRRGASGPSMALSSDGTTAVVAGAISDHAGAAWVFRRTASGWQQLGPKLTASDGSYNDGFGSSVAISASGTTVLIGDWWSTNNRAGSAWVFVDEPFTPPAVAPPAAPMPSLTDLALRPAAFRAARRGPTTGSAPAGTSISYRASTPGTVTFTVLRELTGVRRGGACVRAVSTRALHAARTCFRLQRLGTFMHSGLSGDNHLSFSGRLRGRSLEPGRYVLRAVLTASLIEGKASQARFRITTAR